MWREPWNGWYIDTNLGLPALLLSQWLERWYASQRAYWIGLLLSRKSFNIVHLLVRIPIIVTLDTKYWDSVQQIIPFIATLSIK